MKFPRRKFLHLAAGAVRAMLESTCPVRAPAPTGTKQTEKGA